jgi:hypothetical protein
MPLLRRGVITCRLLGRSSAQAKKQRHSNGGACGGDADGQTATDHSCLALRVGTSLHLSAAILALR